MSFNSVISDAVETIAKAESGRRDFAKKLSPLKTKSLSGYASPELLEENLVKKLESQEVNGVIAGVDSGFVGKGLFSLDIILIKTVSAVFSYKQGKLERANYYPRVFSFPKPYLSNSALDNDEFEVSKSMRRLIEEIDTARETIEKFKPEYMFLDGSIIPQYMDKPRSDSAVADFYKKLIASFEALYSSAEKNKSTIVSCIEDSRGSRFRTILQEQVLSKEQEFDGSALDNCYDSVLLDYMLEQGERSIAFKYSPTAKEHPILSDFSEKWASMVHAAYLKPAKYDRPLRIEFLAEAKDVEKKADKIASITYSLSSMHREYAYPTVLIEADLRARLRPDEINIMYEKILDKLGRQFNVRMRRDSRPF